MLTRLLSVAVVLYAAAHAGAGVPPWVRAAVPASLPESAKSAKAVVLLDERTMTVAAAGEITTRQRRVIRIQTNAGREYGFAAVSFDDDTKVKSFRAWSIGANGEQYEVKDRDAVETQPFDGELYSDARVRVLRIPAAEPGSVVAFEYERRERPYLLQAMWDFQERVPVLVARLQVALPAGWSADMRWSNYKPVEPVNGVWELRDVPAIAAEPRMPAAPSLAGRAGLLFTTTSQEGIRTWNDIAAFFTRLASPRLLPTAEMQAKVKELAKGTPAESVRALARFAQRDVRYVAIEIGIGGYQPHAAADVFRNRYGDCKDKATLLKAMLKELGIESYYVLVHTTRGMIDDSVPLLGSFNHVVLAVAAPQKTHATLQHPTLGPLIVFDPTSTTTPFGLLPEYLQDSRGLLVTPSGGELIALAAHPADSNQLRRKAALQLDAAGTLSGSVEEVRTGTIAAGMRAHLQPLSATERTNYIETMLSMHLANYSASGIAIENVEECEKDLVIRYRISAKQYARKVADMLLVRPRVIGQKPETIVDLAARTHGYVTDGPSLQTDEVEIAVAPELKADELPAAVTMATPSVEYSSHSEFKDGVLRYKRRYALQTFFIPRDSVPELNKAFSKILADERASAVFRQ